MYKAWFDGSYHKNRKLSVLGVYIENEEMEMIYSHSLFRNDLVSSSEAELFALLSLLDVIERQFKNESFLIYGDDRSLIGKIKGKKIENPLILSCLQQLKRCSINLSSVEWTERDYNKADPYTRIGEDNRKKSMLALNRMTNNTEEVEFILTNKAYNTYITQTKRNRNSSKEVAQKKLNRNIKRANDKSFRLNDGTVVYIYFSMLIFTKNEQIIHLSIQGDAKGVLHYQKNLDELEVMHQDTKEEIHA